MNKEKWTWKISADERVYLVNHWMDLSGSIGRSYPFHEGFLLVLFILCDTGCVQCYRSNTKEQLPKLV